MKWLGSWLVITSWVGIGYILHVWHGKDLNTISKHAAQDRKTQVLFAALLLGLGLAFYYWIMSWLVNVRGLGVAFQILISLTVFFQILTGLIPGTTPRMSLLHRVVAYSMASLYLPTALALVLTANLSSLSNLLVWCLIGAMALVSGLFVVGATRQGKLWSVLKPRYIYFQASFIVMFQLIFLVAGYL